jgi:hypothetical protein
MSLEDGTLRIFSLPKGANDLPVTGMPLPRKQFEGIFIYTMSLFAIWSIHTSLTGSLCYLSLLWYFLFSFRAFLNKMHRKDIIY